jgi:hypothetical protein
MELPRTLHGQLYLLSYNRKRKRFDYACTGFRNTHWRFEFALRSAMLTDLYLAGHIENSNGEARVLKSCHHDPLLEKALNRAAGRGWSQLVYRGRQTCEDVCEQLETSGWIRGQHRKMLGLVPERLEVYDEAMIDSLCFRVTDALSNILADQPADPRALAVGLIAVQAQLRAVSGFIDDVHDRERLRVMTLAAIEPILGLYNAIHRQYEEIRSSMGGGF